MKVALITGITGQDGSYLSELLLDKEYKVVGTSRKHNPNVKRLRALEIENDLNKALEKTTSDFLILSFSSDWRFSPERSKEIDINVSISTADLSLDSTLTGSADDQTDFSIINFAEPVGFSTGDKVFYSYSNGDGLIGIETGSYFVDVKGSEQKQIQLYTAPTNIDGGKNLTFSKSTSNGIIEFVLFLIPNSITAVLWAWPF